jgi:hypothetical protein
MKECQYVAPHVTLIMADAKVVQPQKIVLVHLEAPTADLAIKLPECILEGTVNANADDFLITFISSYTELLEVTIEWTGHVGCYFFFQILN